MSEYAVVRDTVGELIVLAGVALVYGLCAVSLWVIARNVVERWSEIILGWWRD